VGEIAWGLWSVRTGDDDMAGVRWWVLLNRCREADGNRALPGCYAATSGNFFTDGAIFKGEESKRERGVINIYRAETVW